MPKKFQQGENSKAAQARARKDAKKQEADEALKKAADDALWEDNDKHVKRKQQRKDDKKRKQTDQIERKQEAARILEDEMKSIKPGKPTAKQSKVTRAEIDASKEKEDKAAGAASKELVHDEKPLEENVNRLVVDGDEARNVEEAIAVLSLKDTALEKHPEKRMRAAFQEYENRQLPILKEENPNLKLSQLKQMIWKSWPKAPENPLNQTSRVYNEKK